MFYTNTLQEKKFINHRMAMIKGWLQGVFSLSEMISLVLPAKISRGRASLTTRYDDFLTKQSELEIKTFMDKNYPGIQDKIQGKEARSLIYQIFVQDEYGAKAFLKPDSVILDAGANIGVFSVLASIMSPQGKIFSFEPAKNTYGLLQENTKYFPQVTTYNMGLGDKQDDMEILTSSRNPSINAVQDSQLALKNKRFFDGSEKISITTIDAFAEKELLSIGRLDLIKIDTEGYEAQILDGARTTIKKYTPTICMSAYHNPGDEVTLPNILREIDSRYVCKKLNKSEEDLVCFIEE